MSRGFKIFLVLLGLFIVQVGWAYMKGPSFPECNDKDTRKTVVETVRSIVEEEFGSLADKVEINLGDCFQQSKTRKLLVCTGDVTFITPVEEFSHKVKYTITPTETRRQFLVRTEIFAP